MDTDQHRWEGHVQNQDGREKTQGTQKGTRLLSTDGHGSARIRGRNLRHSRGASGGAGPTTKASDGAGRGKPQRKRPRASLAATRKENSDWRDEFPSLGRESFFFRMSLDVPNRCLEVLIVFDEDAPDARAPGSRGGVPERAQRVDFCLRERHRRLRLQMYGNLLDRALVAADHQMRMIVPDAASVNNISRFGDGAAKTFPNELALSRVKSHWRILQHFLGGKSLGNVMCIARQRAFLTCFCCGAEFRQLPRPDEIGP
jgi:hypothetical protein